MHQFTPLFIQFGALYFGIAYLLAVDLCFVGLHYQLCELEYLLVQSHLINQSAAAALADDHAFEQASSNVEFVAELDSIVHLRDAT